MCGIAGIIQSASFYSKNDVLEMTTALSHRGPNGEAYWQNETGNTLLGHRRLSIIDLSEAAAQPMHYLDRYSIVHNGEIYNYIELRHELEKKGYSFKTKSDTEMILAAYDHWEDECVQYFDGMFAFAIWDEKEKELFAARDRFGEKPFYYHFNQEQFFFASEIKALCAAGIERRTNLKMLFNFITIGYVDNPTQPEETFFENIFKLPAASFLYYNPADKELIIEKYWDIDTSIQNKKITDKEAVEQFSDLFSTSIKRRLRSDVSIGNSLSGGLDSSSIAAMIHELNKTSPLTAFTASFPGFEKDESAHAKQVAAKFNSPHHIVEISDEDMINDWDKLVVCQEEPFGSASVYAQYKVFELAKKNNVTVLLDGQGADEMLAGYYRYYKWYWQELFQKRKLIKSNELKAARELGINEKFDFKNIIAALFPELATVVLERQYLVNALRQEDLHKDFIRMQSREAYYTVPPQYGLNSRLYFNTCIHGLEELLRYADKNSMAHGREVRLPFLSHELAEFIFSLPAHFKIREGWTKWLLRKTIANKLPDEITWRRDKTGFEPPQQNWMQHKKIQEMITEAKKKLVVEKILNAEAITKPIAASGAFEQNAYDWRYLAAAPYL